MLLDYFAAGKIATDQQLTGGQDFPAEGGVVSVSVSSFFQLRWSS